MSAKIDVEKVNILCLSSDTGGGHRASAQALHDSCVSIYGELHSVPSYVSLLI
jgi:hypothetical protein